ncbi:MAG: lysoplasmalogenase [Leifsonia sp.]
MTDIAATPRRVMMPAFTPFIVVGLVHVLALAVGADAVAHPSKWLLMPALGFALLWAVRPTRNVAVLTTLAAIGLSWAGDVIVDIPGDLTFVLGLTAFLLAHVVYIVLFVRVLRLRRTAWWSIVYAVWFVAFLVVLAPYLGALLVPVAVYGLVLGSMAATAARGGALLAVGGALFVASDTVLALARFLPGFGLPLKDSIVMAGYITAQGLIVLGVARIVLAARARSARVASVSASA